MSSDFRNKLNYSRAGKAIAHNKIAALRRLIEEKKAANADYLSRIIFLA